MGYGAVTPIAKNQMPEETENEMEPGIILYIVLYRDLGFRKVGVPLAGPV